MPPSASDGGSYSEREDSDAAENKCRCLPVGRPLLLLNGEMLLNIQTLLFSGELLFSRNSSLPLFGSVAEQCMGLWRIDEEHRGHEHNAGESFHITVPFLEMGTKNGLGSPFVCWVDVSGAE